MIADLAGFFAENSGTAIELSVLAKISCKLAPLFTDNVDNSVPLRTRPTSCFLLLVLAERRSDPKNASVNLDLAQSVGS